MLSSCLYNSLLNLYLGRERRQMGILSQILALTLKKEFFTFRSRMIKIEIASRSGPCIIVVFFCVYLCKPNINQLYESAGRVWEDSSETAGVEELWISRIIYMTLRQFCALSIMCLLNFRKMFDCRSFSYFNSDRQPTSSNIWGPVNKYLLVSYVCFDICGGIERALSRGNRARMQFPQALCPLRDKQVIRKCNQGVNLILVSKFTQNCLSHAKQLFLYGYGFLPTYPVKMITENGTFVKRSPEKRFFPMYVTTDENRTFRKRCLVSPNWDSNLTPKNHSAEQSPTLRVPMYNLCFCNLTL